MGQIIRRLKHEFCDLVHIKFKSVEKLVDDKNFRLGSVKYTLMEQDIAKTKMELPLYTVRKDALPTFFTDVNELYDALFNEAGETGIFTYSPDTDINFLK